MAKFTVKELAIMRREVTGIDTVTWDKPTIDTALQGVEDELDTLLFDEQTIVDETIIVNTSAQTTKTELDAGRIPIGLVPIVEEWLSIHPVSITTRKVDNVKLSTYIETNNTALLIKVVGMPTRHRDNIIDIVTRRRVSKVL